MKKEEIVTSLRACANREFKDCAKCAYKSAFLTREEAEEALEAMKDE